MAKINPAKIYTLTNIVHLGFIPGSYPTVRNRVMDDMVGDNLLQAQMHGAGRRRQFSIKGENILRYLQANQ